MSRAEHGRERGVAHEHVDVVERRQLVVDEVELKGAARLDVERHDAHPAGLETRDDRLADPARPRSAGDEGFPRSTAHEPPTSWIVAASMSDSSGRNVG